MTVQKLKQIGLQTATTIVTLQNLWMKSMTLRFPQNNIHTNNCMVTENRPAAYVISQLQCAVVYRRGVSIVEHNTAAPAKLIATTERPAFGVNGR